MKRRKARRMAGAALLILSGVLLLSSAASWRGPETVRREARLLTAAELPDISLPQGAVRINQADVAELMTLPGIGETIGQRIVEERAQGGPFHYPEDLTVVKGVGPKLVEGLRDLLNLEVTHE